MPLAQTTSSRIIARMASVSGVEAAERRVRGHPLAVVVSCWAKPGLSSDVGKFGRRDKRRTSAGSESLTARLQARQLAPLRRGVARAGRVADRQGAGNARKPMNAQPWLKSYPAGVRWDAPIDISPCRACSTGRPSASARFRRCSSWTSGSPMRSSRRSPTAPPRASRSSASGRACMSASICPTRPTTRSPSSAC